MNFHVLDSEKRQPAWFKKSVYFESNPTVKYRDRIGCALHGKIILERSQEHHILQLVLAIDHFQFGVFPIFPALW